jgi:hypothetical protein
MEYILVQHMFLNVMVLVRHSRQSYFPQMVQQVTVLAVLFHLMEILPLLAQMGMMTMGLVQDLHMFLNVMVVVGLSRLNYLLQMEKRLIYLANLFQ